MAVRNEDEYVFADAYTGCYASRLMKWQDLIRMVNCPDLSSAVSVLQEFGYGESKELADGDVEAFIRREQTKLFEMIFKNLTGREEMAPYLFPFDYHNIKVCLKSELLGITPDDNYLISTGDIDWMEMVAMIRERNYDRMRLVMRDAVTEALDMYGRGGDPQEIDLILDKACYKDMADSVRETESEFLTDFMEMKIDTLNLKSFARLRIIDRPWSFFKKIFIEGGSLREDFFLGCYEESFSQIAERMIDGGLKKALAEGGRELDEDGDFILYEKLLDDALMEHNKKAFFVTTGIEPIAGFWYGKEGELDNVRMILHGKLTGSSAEDVTRLLRIPYV
ncbi:MAG: V-type ATPase subunit [Eubacteriaceae bacterium]|nr:V-type ATPase subunit [Eubacteriaceae bacterium]